MPEILKFAKQHRTSAFVTHTDTLPLTPATGTPLDGHPGPHGAASARDRSFSARPQAFPDRLRAPCSVPPAGPGTGTSRRNRHRHIPRGTGTSRGHRASPAGPGTSRGNRHIPRDTGTSRGHRHIPAGRAGPRGDAPRGKKPQGCGGGQGQLTRGVGGAQGAGEQEGACEQTGGCVGAPLRVQHRPRRPRGTHRGAGPGDTWHCTASPESGVPAGSLRCPRSAQPAPPPPRFKPRRAQERGAGGGREGGKEGTGLGSPAGPAGAAVPPPPRPPPAPSAGPELPGLSGRQSPSRLGSGPLRADSGGEGTFPARQSAPAFPFPPLSRTPRVPPARFSSAFTRCLYCRCPGKCGTGVGCSALPLPLAPG